MIMLFTENKLISSNQSRFRLGDSVLINYCQLHEILSSIDIGVHFDISKAFDKV